MSLYALVESPLGELLYTGREDALTGLYYTDHGHAPNIAPAWVRRDTAPAFAETTRQLREYIEGHRQTFDLPIELTGSKFEVKVWQAILGLPFGHTIAPEELARQIGEPEKVRELIDATAANPVAWVIPSFRVTGQSGVSTVGLGRHQVLLKFEAARAAGREFLLAWDEPASLR